MKVPSWLKILLGIVLGIVVGVAFSYAVPDSSHFWFGVVGAVFGFLSGGVFDLDTTSTQTGQHHQD